MIFFRMRLFGILKDKMFKNNIFIFFLYFYGISKYFARELNGFLKILRILKDFK